MERINMRGEYLIKIKNTKTGKTKEIRLHNLLTQINQTIRLAMLNGTASSYTMNDLNIVYFAFGTGTTVPTVNDTQLASEQYRKQYTSKAIVGNAVQSICSLNSSEANFNISEIGVFCGSSATAAANSGTMISRVLVNIEKNENMVVDISRSDICTIGG